MWDALIDTSLAYQDQSTAPDGTGGTTQSWAKVVDFPCAIQPASSNTITLYAKRQITVTTAIYTTTDLNNIVPRGINSGDRVTDGSTFWIIKGFQRQQNSILSPEPIYRIDCEQSGDS